MNRKIALVMALSLLNPVWVMAASFDCAKAESMVEMSICEDANVGHMDEMLSANYKAVMAAAKAANNGSEAKIKADQKKWVQERNDCTMIDCIASAYVDRIDAVCDSATANGLNVESCKKYDPEKDHIAAEDGDPVPEPTFAAPQPVVQQPPTTVTEPPVQIGIRGNSIQVTSVVDNVTVNKITINRGNCKTIDLKAKREEVAAKAAKNPQYKSYIEWHSWHAAGILKYGDVDKWDTSYGCIPREIVTETNLGNVISTVE